MTIKGKISKGEYYDSVSLMMAAKKLRESPGVVDSAVIMGTAENRAILESTGMLPSEFARCGDTDLLVVIKAETEKAADSAINSVTEILKSIKGAMSKPGVARPRNIEAASRVLPDANLALISVAGKYAGEEASKALQLGLHVMLFSDNVQLETEIELKKYAVENGLLLMGPDCGTAIINGVPLAFANVVNRGSIGIVAASGTGLQETSCLISNAGLGISQAIGTGSRDVGEAVGGMMFIDGIRRLAEDPDTKVILLVSKPPHESVLAKIREATKGIDKPIVAVFLGAYAGNLLPNAHTAKTLDEAASIAISLAKGDNPEYRLSEIKERNKRLEEMAVNERKKLKDNQRYIRGLFSGGTFVSEAQVLLKDNLPEIYSNSPIKPVQKLANPLKSEKNTLIDLGSDEFTVGRPHPMIDYSLRIARIVDEACDESVAVILLDIVLGYGSNPNPLAEIVPAIKTAKISAQEKGRYLSIICSVTGTDSDPQNRTEVIRGLRDAGALAMESNAETCRLAGLIAGGKIS